MSNPILPTVVGLGVAVSAFTIVAVAGPSPAPPAVRSAQDGEGPEAVPSPIEGSLAAPPSSASEAPAGLPAAEGPPRTVLLMKDGNVREYDGPVAEDRGDYVISLPLGPIRVPKARVERAFDSIRAAYEYQRDHLPDRDPDEHLRLARWCLTRGMEAEAAEQLRALLAWSPGDPTAEAMLKSLAASAASRSARDTDVVRAAADAGGLMGADGAPRELADSVLSQIRAYKGPVAPPSIAGLPEALAVRRFQEYGQTVHVVLQNRCAQCHDELSDRNFRLVRARNPKDLRNALLVRTNLDATLGLVDRENPGHSPLLINAAMPHGPDQRPILPNPDSPEYRALWTWIESLRDGTSTPASAPAPITAPAPMPTAIGMASAPSPMSATPALTVDPAFGGGFAAQRAGTVAAPAPTGPAPAGAPAFTPYPHAINQQLQMDAVHPSAPADLDFQTVSPLLGASESAPLMIDGRPVRPIGPAGASTPSLPGAAPPAPMPTATAPPPGSRTTPPGSPAPMAGPPRPGSPAVPPSPAPAEGGQAGVVQLPDGTQIISQADGSKVMKLPTGEVLPYIDKAAVEGETPRPEATRRDLKIDPALLEKLQKQRNGGQ